MTKTIKMIISRTSEFKRNYKKLKRKHYDMKRLKHVINLIINDDTEILIKKHKDHKLKGKYHEYRELHVDRQYDDNWLLIYRIRNNELELHVLELINTGNHDHIFR